MPDTQSLKARILNQRRDLTEEELNKLIEEKKKQIGAGYLSDAGACWLIASELGITLEDEPQISTEFTPSTIQIGMQEATVKGRVLSIYPTKTYTKKDGLSGRFRRMVIFDTKAYLPVTLWDEASTLPEHLSIKVGSLVKIVRGYVRAGLDGKPVLHVGYRGSIEVIQEDEAFITLEEISKDVSEVKAVERSLIVKGVVDSEPKHSEFTKRDGGLGRVSQFYIKGKAGLRVRVVLWDSSPDIINTISVGSGVLITAVRSKILPNGDIELHGDEATTIQPYKIEVSKKTFRLLSKGASQQEATTILLLDETKNIKPYIIKGEALQVVKNMPYDTLIEVNTQKPVIYTPSELKIIKEDKSSIPKSTELLTKIKDVKGASDILFLKVIALSKPIAQDITAKDGSTVKKAELIVGDETGEIRLNAWRELTDKIVNIKPGERLLLRGVSSQVGRDGAPHLMVKAYTDVEKIK
ncbi:MAG: hypothetical protein QXW32_01060 [Nitrososphaerales archaeon]